jgi:CBS domain-containing protein
MLVKDVMIHPVRTCRPATSAGEAAAAMADAGVGCLPVVDSHRRLIGIVTDRDVCVLVARRRDPWQAPVADIMAADVISCRASDDVEVALVAMKENGFRRIPAVDACTHVVGLVSIDDVIRRTGTGRGVIAGEAVLDVLRHICEREAPALRV